MRNQSTVEKLSMIVENARFRPPGTLSRGCGFKKSLRSYSLATAVSPPRPGIGRAYSRWFGDSRRRLQWPPTEPNQPSKMRSTSARDRGAVQLGELRGPVRNPVYLVSVTVSSCVPFSPRDDWWSSWSVWHICRHFRLSIFRISQDCGIQVRKSRATGRSMDPFLWNSGEGEEKIYEKYKYFVHHGSFCGILWL
jgi:hypothetical protein